MKAINRLLTEIINGNKQFIIPVFQRDYRWTTEEFHQMWDDILRASRREGGHFIGSIVYVEAGTVGAAFQSWLVIDGQQRLASLTLLLAALRDHINETEWSGTEDSPTADGINTYFLKNAHQMGERGYKLVLRRADDATLRTLVDGKARCENRSKLIIEAYECFRNRLRDPGCDLDAIYRGINRLQVVDVTLERRFDNPQLIFESMNSTGVGLTQSDLVRNYLLMGLDEAEQTRLYDEYWRRIEILFKPWYKVFDSFLRDYIALRSKSMQPMHLDRVYEEFKAFRRSDDKPLETLLQDMARVAPFYASFHWLDPVPPEWLADAMGNMRKIGTTPGLLVMRLYDNYERNLLSQKEFTRAVVLIESYILRRDVLGLSARNYWSTFARVAHESELDFESFQVALALLRDNNRFPEDEEFRRALEERDLYGLRNCKHILDRLENAEQREPSPVHSYSIEHIMPQEIAEVPGWQKMLGVDWQKLHDTWVHRLGNLTLTAYNSRYSNKPFEDKKTMEGGFRESAVRLNGYIQNQGEWVAAQMLERGKRLADRALQIWPYHEADRAATQREHIRGLRTSAARKSSDDLKMEDDVRRLLSVVRKAIGELNDDVIEIVERKSICCYGPGFFAELLPMAFYVRVILPLGSDEVDIPDGLEVHDAPNWRHVPNRVHTDCDLLVDIKQEDEVSKLIPMIRQAFDQQGL